MAAISSNYKVSKNERTVNEDKNEQMHLQIRLRYITNTRKALLKLTNTKTLTALLRQNTKHNTTIIW